MQVHLKLTANVPIKWWPMYAWLEVGGDVRAPKESTVGPKLVDPCRRCPVLALHRPMGQSLYFWLKKFGLKSVMCSLSSNLHNRLKALAAWKRIEFQTFSFTVEYRRSGDRQLEFANILKCIEQTIILCRQELPKEGQSYFNNSDQQPAESG